jgi:hypothetical protein
VYVWIWRKLPGGTPGKVAGSLVLLGGVVAVLLLVVFPWAEPRLPFNNVNVDQPASHDAPTVAPSSTAAALSPISTAMFLPSASVRA